VALLADHGEDLEAHDRSHGRTLTEAAVRVPLVLSAPGLAPGRVSSLTSTLDVFPTLLAYTETPPPPALDGRDLRAPVAPSVVLSEGWSYLSDRSRDLDQVMASDGRYRFIRCLIPSSTQFESVAASASQEADLIADRRRPVLEAAVNSYLDQVQPPDL
jgi:choline-sulfatase